MKSLFPLGLLQMKDWKDAKTDKGIKRSFYCLKQFIKIYKICTKIMHIIIEFGVYLHDLFEIHLFVNKKLISKLNSKYVF